MRFLILFGIFMLGYILAGAACASEKVILYPTYPGTTTKDFLAPRIVIDDDETYQTFPGTNLRDYSAPQYKAVIEEIPVFTFPENNHD